MRSAKNTCTSIFSLFQLTGLVLIVTGGVIQGVYSKYLDFLGSSFFNAPVLLVVVGVVSDKSLLMKDTKCLLKMI